VNPNAFQVEVLTQFDEHIDQTVDQTKRLDYLPLSHLQNPKNRECTEVPPIKSKGFKPFQIRVSLLSEVEPPLPNSSFLVSLYIDGVQASRQVMSNGPNTVCLISKIRHKDKLFDLTFDPVLYTQHESEINIDPTSLKNTGITIKIRKSYHSSDRMIIDGYSSEHVVGLEGDLPQSGIKIKEGQSKVHGLKATLGSSIPTPPKLTNCLYANHTYVVQQDIPAVWKIRFGNQINKIHFCIAAGIEPAESTWKADLDDTVEFIELPSSEEESSGRSKDRNPKKKVKRDLAYIKWNPALVGKWINAIDPSYESLGYGKIFKMNEVDGEVLREMTSTQLDTLGIKIFGHRQEILIRIKELNE
jgi:hypothetical protein